MWRGQAVIESPPDDTLVSCVKDLTPGRVLELGCGSGANAVWLAEQGWTVEAIDFSEEAVNVGRQLAAKRGVAVNFSVGDATAFKPENQFDLIISFYIFVPRAGPRCWKWLASLLHLEVSCCSSATTSPILHQAGPKMS